MRKVTKPRTAAEREQRLRRILEALDRLYPDATCALDHKDAWQLLVATILSAQCTDERVNMVTPELFRRYRSLQALAGADVSEVAQVVRSTGFFNNKAKSIVGAARKIAADYGGQVPREMEKLLTVPGAARKTANVVLGTAYGIAGGIVVDTHVARIARRLGLTAEKDPVKIEQELMKRIPKEKWILFAHQLIQFGRRICAARRPACGECPVERLCWSADKKAP